MHRMYVFNIDIEFLYNLVQRLQIDKLGLNRGLKMAPKTENAFPGYCQAPKNYLFWRPIRKEAGLQPEQSTG